MGGDGRTPAALAAVGFCLALGACGDEAPVDPDQEIIVRRQQFEIELRSWAPIEDRVAIDVVIRVNGTSRLKQLTVDVRQAGEAGDLLRSDLVQLDVAGMDFDGQRGVTISVPWAGDGVRGVAVLRENIPERSRRGDYPEFADAADS